MRDQFGILGLGQCGSNIATLFEQKQYTTVYLNTSKEDLNAIKGVHKIHIEGADGAAKDRRRVLQLATDSFQGIIEKINSILTQKYILVIFSSSGGTGSGLSTPILRYLSQIGKVCIPVAVLPNENMESAKACENAYNSCAELMSIQGLGATFLLDNVNDDKFAINQKFVNEFDAFINIKNSSIYGNIDMAERKQMLSCPGVAVIGKLSKTKSTAPELVHSLHNGIYAKIESKNAYYLGISTSNRSIDINSITKEFNGVYDVFIGISEATSIIIALGLQWPYQRIQKFKNKFELTAQTINESMMQQHPDIQPLQGLSIVNRRTIQPTATANPRDILLGLLNN